MFKENRRFKVLTLGTMCFSLFMALLDSTVVYLALPAIQSHLQTEVAKLQWIINAYSLLFASLLLTGGTLGDRFGRKRLFLIGLGIFTAASALCAMAPNIETLIFGRALQGIGAAGLLPGSLAILTHTFTDPAERAQAFGIWSAISGLALLVGPLLGGILVNTFGWQSIFLINIPIGILSFVLVTRFILESRDPNPKPVDFYGQALWILSLGSLTFALIEGNQWGWTSPLILGLFIAAFLLFVIFFLVERSIANPMFPLRFFTNPTFSAANAVGFLIGFGLFAMFFILSLYMQQIQGYTSAEAGLRFLPATIAMIIMAPLAGKLAGHLGSRLPMIAGMVLAGTSLLLFLRLDATTPYATWWWIVVMMGLGIGCTMAPTTAAVMGAVPSNHAGMASATLTTYREAGGLFGIALLGAITSGQFREALEDSLTSFPLKQTAREQILTLASQGEMQGNTALPLGIETTTFQKIIGEAFVSGMHSSMIVGGSALFLGALIAAIFIRRTFPQKQNSSTSQIK